MDSAISFCYTYPLDSDSSSGECYPTFEQPELDVVKVSSNRFMTHLKILLLLLLLLLLLIVITTSKYSSTKKKRGEREKTIYTTVLALIFKKIYSLQLV